MIFQPHGEVDAGMLSAFQECEDTLRFALRRALKQGALAEIDWTFCYGPIVMPPEYADLFPPRHLCQRGQRRLYHAPVIDHGAFRDGGERDQLMAYIDGMAQGVRLLSRAGFEARVQASFRFGVDSIREELDAMFSLDA